MDTESWSRIALDGYEVSSHMMSITVRSPRGDRPGRSVAEATLLFASEGWYLNRVFVEDGQRHQDIGGRLVGHLKKAVARRGGLFLLVEPGGYGSDIVLLHRFYLRHGFVVDAEFRGENTFVWRPNRTEITIPSEMSF